MVLIAILLGTLGAGIGSVWFAAVLSFGVLARYTQHMLSLAAGALLATAFMHLLPEAFESKVSPQALFAALLAGLVFFFLLDKAELWHHGHEHHDGGRPSDGDGHGHKLSHHHDHARERSAGPLRASSAPSGGSEVRGATSVRAHHSSGGWTVMAGDSVHAFGDGILIASAFVADLRLGVVASLAVLVHEVPHHMGDLVVMRQTSDNRRAALIKVTLAGSVTALGGFAGYALVDQLYGYLPFFLVLASSSFVYVALADLIPQLQRRVTARETAAQIAWLGIGIGLVALVSGAVHR